LLTIVVDRQIHALARSYTVIQDCTADTVAKAFSTY